MPQPGAPAGGTSRTQRGWDLPKRPPLTAQPSGLSQRGCASCHSPQSTVGTPLTPSLSLWRAFRGGDGGDGRGVWAQQRAAGAWERRAAWSPCGGHQSVQLLPLVKTVGAHTAPGLCENSCVCCAPSVAKALSDPCGPRGITLKVELGLRVGTKGRFTVK